MWNAGDLAAQYRAACRAEADARASHAKAEADGRHAFARTGAVSLEGSRAVADARHALVVAQARALKARWRLVAAGGRS